MDPRLYGDYAASILKWLDDTLQGKYDHDAIWPSLDRGIVGPHLPKACLVPFCPSCSRYGDFVRLFCLCEELHSLSVLVEQYSHAQNESAVATTLKRIYSVAETVASTIGELGRHCEHCDQAAC